MDLVRIDDATTEIRTLWTYRTSRIVTAWSKAAWKEAGSRGVTRWSGFSASEARSGIDTFDVVAGQAWVAR
jgi:hypothetical protein